MPRKRTGIVIEDLTNRKGFNKATTKAYRIRVWDSRQLKYQDRSFDTITEGMAWAEQTRARFTLGSERAGKLPLELVGENYLDALRQEGRTSDHIKKIKMVVDALLVYGARDMRSPTFCGQVQSWLNGVKVNRTDRVSKKELSPITKNRFLRHIRSVCNFAVKKDYIHKDPTLSIGFRKTVRKVKPIFTVSELREIMKPSNRDDQYWVHFALLAYTGCRHQEATHLRWEDIDWEGKRISIKYQGDEYQLKNNKERYVPLQSELRQILSARGNIKGYILSDERERKRLDPKAFQRFVKRCGVQPCGRSPHSMRHSWASLMIASGVDSFKVQEYLGHQSTETTKGYSRSVMMYEDSVQDWPRGEFMLINAGVSESGKVAQ